MHTDRKQSNCITVANVKKAVRNPQAVIFPAALLSLCVLIGIFLTGSFKTMEEHDLVCLHVAWVVNSTAVHAMLVALVALEMALRG